MESKQSIQSRHAQGIWSQLDADLAEYDRRAYAAQGGKELHIDIETYCELDLTEVGVYRYATHPSFKILLFAFKFEVMEEPQVVDLAQGEEIPAHVRDAMLDPLVLKIAQNAAFEITCISHFYGIELDLTQWYCTMVASSYNGLPSNLDKIGAALNLTHQKDPKGKALIKYFTQPCKPTKTNGGRRRNLPHHDPEKWAQFVEYNAQDVRAEDEIYEYLKTLPPVPAIEWRYWRQDQVINNRGILVDLPLVIACIETNAEFMQQTWQEMKDLTGVSNPNSLDQVKAWLSQELGEEVTKLRKEDTVDALASEFLPDNVRRLYELRSAGSNTSVSKYATMLEYLCPKDGRIRNLIQFYGAATGRYAGRGPQIQNLKKMLSKWLKTDELIKIARQAVKKDLAMLLYADVSDLLSQLVRTALVASRGKRVIPCDFAAIEARVLAWLAGESWVLEVFNTHGRLYEATASKMFNVPLEQVTKASPWRAKGKIAALALGYQGGKGALINMGAIRDGLKEEELDPIKVAWRKANPKIVKFWRDVETHFKQCYLQRRTVTLRLPFTSLRFDYCKGYVFIYLPSGRRLSYYGVKVDERGRITYWGMATKAGTGAKIWSKRDTYGGSLVENITQAVARDCLVEAMDVLFNEYEIIFHVHDEIVIEQDTELAEDTLKRMEEVMSTSPEWAKELPLTAEGFISPYYRKDLD